MTVTDSSWLIHHTLSDKRHQNPHPGRPLPVADLLGRTDELELIDSLLAGHGQVGRGLLLRGDPGVGKTALLDAAAGQAEAVGMRVLRASGAQFEAGIGFSAAHQLLYPLRESVDRLAAGHRDVLRQVLGLATGPALDPLVISAAVLTLLDEAAAARPLLLLVDDVPWIDHASAAVLGFVARRIETHPIALLAATRTGLDSVFDQVRVPEREIGPLAEQPAAILLDTRYPDLAATVRQRLLDEAAGNPLALRELPGSLTDRQLSGRDPLPAFLPLSRRLEAVFAAGVHTLPAPTRQVLLAAALQPEPSLAALPSAVQGRAHGDDLGPAQQAELVRVDTLADRLVFRHPLIRSAIVQMTSPDERRSAHRALAAALADEPGRQAWHLAEAAVGPDETVAKALEETALSAAQRGGASAAVTALVRAGELSPQPSDRSRRLVEAAFLANVTGSLGMATRLLADARRRADDTGQAQRTPNGSIVAATAAIRFTSEGDIDAAHRLLARALDDADTAHANSGWVNDILYALRFVCEFGARPESWELFDTALARFDPHGATPLRLCYDAYVDPTRASQPVREGLAHAFAALPADPPSWRFAPLAYAAMRVDALSEYRHLCRRMIERERDGGAIAMVVAGLLLLSIDATYHGPWDEAEALAREALDLATVHGCHLYQGQLRCQLAYIAAARGDLHIARALIDEVTTWAVPRGLGLAQALSRHVLALAALGQGDYEEAYVQASWINPAGAPSPGIPGRRMVMDLVEAAVRTGRTQEARAHVAAARHAGIDQISARTALITAGAAAIAAPDDEAGPLFEAALSLPEVDRWPFEHGRIQLAYGQWLRRTRDSSGARRHLRAALDIFDRLGARPWAVRAHNELRATGFAAADRANLQAATLTTQERQIAELAATGLTNKQIGERLFLSHRTVGGHLHRLYPKLGITARAALRDALETITSEENDQTPRPASPTEQ